MRSGRLAAQVQAMIHASGATRVYWNRRYEPVAEPPSLPAPASWPPRAELAALQLQPQAHWAAGLGHLDVGGGGRMGAGGQLRSRVDHRLPGPA